MQRVEAYEAIVDDRGEIRDLLREVQIDSVTLIRSRKGAVRGNHYHRETTQYTYVLEGEITWVTQSPGGARQEGVAMPGDLIISPPNEHHAMAAATDAVLMVFTKGPRGGLNYESDTFRLSEPLLK